MFRKRHTTATNKPAIEEFKELLLKKHWGAADDKDNCRLEELKRTNEEVRQYHQQVTEKYPRAKLDIVCKRRRVIKFVVIGVLVLAAGGAVCALYFQPENPKVAHPSEIRFYREPLKNLIKQASKQYGKTIVLDQPSIGEIPSSGVLYNDAPLGDYLDNLTLPFNLKHETDSSGVIHISYK